MPEAHEHATPLSHDELSLIEAIRRAQSRGWMDPDGVRRLARMVEADADSHVGWWFTQHGVLAHPEMAGGGA